MTQGNTVKLLLKFSVPMLIGNIFQQLYNLADSVIVGQLIGADALAAIGATASILFSFLHFVTVLVLPVELLLRTFLAKAMIQK